MFKKIISKKVLTISLLVFLFSITNLKSVSVNVDPNYYTLDPNVSINDYGIYKFSSIKQLLPNGSIVNELGATKENMTLKSIISEINLDKITFTLETYFENGSLSHGGLFTQSHGNIRADNDRYIITTNQTLLEEALTQISEANYTITSSLIKINSTNNISDALTIFTECIFNKTTSWMESSYQLSYNSTHSLIQEISVELVSFSDTNPSSSTTIPTSPPTTTSSSSPSSSSSTSSSGSSSSSSSSALTSSSSSAVSSSTSTSSSSSTRSSTSNDSITTSSGYEIFMIALAIGPLILITQKRRK